MIIRDKNPKTISRFYNFYDIIIKFFMKKNYKVEILNHEGKKIRMSGYTTENIHLRL